MKKDTYYFSHDFGARKDPSILTLLSLHGWQGYGVYWALIEMMYEAPDSRIKAENMDAIAYDLHLEKGVLRDVVKACRDAKLFQADKEGFWSESVKRRKEERAMRWRKYSEAGTKGNETKWGATDHHAKRSERLTAARLINSHTKSEWLDMLAFFDNKCVRCGCDGPIVKDHVKPIYQGGSDGIENLQPLCRTCNSSKGPENKDFRLLHTKASQMPRIWLKMPPKASQGKETKGKETKGDKKKEGKKDFVPPSLEEVKKYFLEKGFSEELAARAFETYAVADWVDTRGNKVLNWKQKMNSTWFRDENKPAAPVIPLQNKQHATHQQPNPASYAGAGKSIGALMLVESLRADLNGTTGG